MNEFQDTSVSTCANCGRQIRKVRYGHALIWEHVQRPGIVCTDDRGRLLGVEVHATPADDWSNEDLDFLAAMRIRR